MRHIFLLAFTCSALSASAQESPFDPWFTGPLLTPTGNTIPKNYFNIEPYLYFTIYNGVYGNHWHANKTPNFYAYSVQVPTKFGVTDWLDLGADIAASYQRTEGVHNYVFDDLLVHANFQLYSNTATHSFLKFTLSETFPTGRYQRLKADKLFTDEGGLGSYSTSFGLTFKQTLQFAEFHYLAYRANFTYSIFTPVRVHGINSYGGVPSTRGTVRPGQTYIGAFGIEYSLSRNWALACDLTGAYSNKTSFSGRAGLFPNGTPAILSSPPSVQFTVAPAIEYNFSAGLGLIAGPWMTFAGRNTSRFISGVIALNYFGPYRKGAKSPGQYIPSGTGGGK